MDIRERYGELISDLENFPVSFCYRGVRYTGFSGEHFSETARRSFPEEDRLRTQIELCLDRTLTVTLEAACYPEYGAMEWTVWFGNPSAEEDSGILENVDALSAAFPAERPVLKGILGDHENQYAPYARDLLAEPVRFVSPGGRATHINFPYFYLETAGWGMFLALGWGGTWEAEFRYDQKTSRVLCRGAGTLGMRTYLRPGERVRTPLTALLFCEKADEQSAMNIWRRWFVACNLPAESADGTCVRPYSTMFLAYDTGRPNSDGSISEYDGSWKRSMDAYYGNGLRADFRWFDAGWYVDPYGKTVESDWWGTVGTWEMDAKKWPGDSFLQSVRYARRHGTRTLMWFEPEHVTHLEGMVANYGYRPEWAIRDPNNANSYLNNLGHPDCLKWTLDRVIGALEQSGADLYREDFNMDPAPFFAIGDRGQGPDRTGITENFHMQGHYALWDGILDYCAGHGKCTFIDSCASGGGRNDLESMRRALPFLRSDSDRTTTDLRLAMTARLARWLPYTGAMAKESEGQLDNGRTDLYTIHTTLLPHVCYQAAFYHERETLDWETLRRGQRDWAEISPYLLKDFYVLTPFRATDDGSGWTVFLYYDPERDAGALQAFRPADCAEETCRIRMRGVAPDRYYRLRDPEGGNGVERIQGDQLIAGYLLRAEKPRTSLLLFVEPCD